MSIQASSPLNWPPAYAAARRALAVADLRDHGWLRVNGPDRLAFLQRLSTNDFRNLTPGQGLPTVLTNPLGRVLGFVTAYAGESDLYLRTAPGQAAALLRYLNGLIFFNDHVEVTDASREVAQFGLYGPEAAALLEGPSAATLAPYAWSAATLRGVSLTTQRGGPLQLPDWYLVVPAAGAEAAWSALRERAPVLDPATLEALRVETGLPAWGHELSDQVTPLEAGLAAAVSYTKGCYTGQEVIARQTHYDKITRRLAGLLLPAAEADQPPQPYSDLAGASVSAGAGRPGFVGAVVRSPALARPIALAVVPREAAEPGSQVVLRHGGQTCGAQVCALPFVSRS